MNSCDICGRKKPTEEKIENVTLNYYNICNSKKCEKIVKEEFNNNNKE